MYFAVAALALAAFAPVARAEEGKAKNVILMISDGIGFNGWEAAKYYQGSLPYDTDDFKFYGMTTYMKNTIDPEGGHLIWSKGKDAAEQNWVGIDQGYNKEKMWSDFNYARGESKGDYYRFTDSAAAATAMYTGTKTYNSAVSYSVEGEDLKTIAEIAAEHGKSTGAISSVQFSHATPAAVDAHTYYRYNKTEIASQMLRSDLDVIMGGDAYVDSEGEFPGGVNGYKSQASADEFGEGFEVVDEDHEWDALVGGTNVPDKVLGTFSGSTLDGRAKPTLEEMTKGALNVLKKNPEGFFMMVEGGAIDWQNHANNADLMMREQVDFDNSVSAVMNWIETEGGGWDENLLIVTSDHETGGIWGEGTVIDDNGTPNDHTDDVVNPMWQNVVDNGEGNMPGMQYTSGGHTNVLVPMWARGTGSEMFEALLDGSDENAAAFWRQFGGSEGWDGSYIDNTDIFTVMNDAYAPEPATMSLLALGGLGVLARRRRNR
jgi:alkaline phosphatase